MKKRPICLPSRRAVGAAALAALVFGASCSSTCGAPSGDPAPPASVAVTAPVGAISSAGQRTREQQVDRDEDMTESFADAMLDLAAAMQLGHRPQIQDYFSPSVLGGGFPAPGGEPHDKAPGVRERAWALAPDPAAVPRGQVLESLSRFLDHFSDVEDVRFKVARGEVGGARDSVKGHLKLSVVGRDGAGHREWFRGKAVATGRRLDGRWVLDELRMTEASSLVAARELFTDVSAATGLARQAYRPLHTSEARRQSSLAATPGAAVADVDLDGLLDVLTVDGASLSLYRNKGDGTFALSSQGTPGLELDPTRLDRWQTPLFVDQDNDGDPDLLLVGQVFVDEGKRPGWRNETRLLENRMIPDGKLAFRDVSERLGPGRFETGGRSPVAADVNGDGIPDFYVPEWRRQSPHRGDRQLLPDSYTNATNGAPNHFFLSKADGTYAEVAREMGVDGHDWSMSAAFLDADGDGDLDLLVANDYGPNRLYLNQGSRFVEAAVAHGLDRGGAAMGLSLGDFDNDGVLDIHSTNMSSNAGERVLSQLLDGPSELNRTGLAEVHAVFQGNRLYKGLGGGKFEDVTLKVGPFPAGWAWGGGFIDVDNDGWEDVFTPNGRRSGKSMHDT